jgi:hypothetical protein
MNTPQSQLAERLTILSNGFNFHRKRISNGTTDFAAVANYLQSVHNDDFSDE